MYSMPNVKKEKWPKKVFIFPNAKYITLFSLVHTSCFVRFNFKSLD